MSPTVAAKEHEVEAHQGADVQVGRREHDLVVQPHRQLIAVPVQQEIVPLEVVYLGHALVLHDQVPVHPVRVKLDLKISGF